MSDTDTETATEAPALEAGALQQILDELKEHLGDAVLDSVLERNDLWVRVDRESWHRTVEICKNVIGLKWFCFLSGIDWQPNPDLLGEKAFGGIEGDEEEEAEAAGAEPTEMSTGLAGGETRFQVLCRLTDVRRHAGINLKADLDEADPRIASIHDLYRGADWHERETWEMYGFHFDGHPGLRHLYLPSGFEGHPLRKDFPLLARQVKPWPGLVGPELIPDHLDPKKIEEAQKAQEADEEALAQEVEAKPEPGEKPADEPRAAAEEMAEIADRIEDKTGEGSE